MYLYALIIVYNLNDDKMSSSKKDCHRKKKLLLLRRQIYVSQSSLLFIDFSSGLNAYFGIHKIKCLTKAYFELQYAIIFITIVVEIVQFQLHFHCNI